MVLRNVKETDLSERLSLRSNRRDLYEKEANNFNAGDKDRKAHQLNLLMRRGKRRHERYFRSEKERLQAEASDNCFEQN